MKEVGVFRVLGRRDYRGHEPGTEFPALLEPKAERRAIDRGSIERIGSMVCRPGNFTLPRGWLESSTQTTEAPEGAFFMPKGGK